MRMLGDRHFEDTRKAFSDQFTPDGDGFVYRKHLKGPAIRVTAAERDRFIATFDRRQRWLTWGLVGVMLLLAAAFIAYLTSVDFDAFEQEFSVLWIFAGLAPVMILFVAVFMRVWDAPSRELAGRAEISRALTRDEASATMMRRTSWGRIWGGLALAAVSIWQLRAKLELSPAWDWLWAALAAGAVALTGYWAYRKRRSERE